MSANTIARRYAQALADVASQNREEEKVKQELSAFAGFLHSSEDFAAIVASPVVSQSDKLKILNSIIERTRPGKTVQNLLRLLLRHYRLQYLELVNREFEREMNRRAGIVPAEVVTASPVAEGDRAALSARLGQLTGKRVQLQFRTDPSIIGGAITKVGSVVYDGSIRTRLDTIKRRLAAGGEV